MRYSSVRCTSLKRLSYSLFHNDSYLHWQDVSEDKTADSIAAVGAPEETPVKVKKGRWANHIKKSDLAKMALAQSPIGAASTPAQQLTSTPASADTSCMASILC